MAGPKDTEDVARSRAKTTRKLIEYFCRTLAEDPQDGTEFDCDIIDALEAVERRHREEVKETREGTATTVIEVRYLTDDRDDEDGNEMVITAGKNGDWYIAVVPEGQGTIGRGVRISTSGGAQVLAPGLGRALALAFSALANAQGSGIKKKCV